jgi:hypothetical protein
VKKHYSLGPSGAPAWSLCAAKPTREAGLPDQRSPDAAWGTVAHDVAERELTGRFVPGHGCLATVDAHGEVAYLLGDDVAHAARPGDIHVDDEMLDCVNAYVGIVRGLPGEIHIESRVPIDHVTGEPGGSGTADCVAIQADHMHVVDLKGGVGVKVDAFDVVAGVKPVYRPNLQLALYAEGALRKHDPERRIKSVTLMIVQPRLQHVSEFTVTREELDRTMAYLRERAEATRAPNPVAVPGEKQCRFCRAKATCPELQDLVLRTALEDFDKARPTCSRTASEALELVPLVEEWCKAVRARVFADLQAGRVDPRWKLVRGRAGHRRWTNAVEAEAALITALPYRDLYRLEMVSPAQAEKALKKRDSQTWAALQELIAQPPGAASVAPLTDRRPALVGSEADVFSDLTD